MVGHSGQLEPTIKACEAVDAQLGRIYKAIKERNGSWLITADHGNAEMMVDPVTGGPHTAHTTNPVPMIYVAEEANHYRLRTDGSLRDISPTLLNLLEARPAQGDDRRRPAHAHPQLVTIHPTEKASRKGGLRLLTNPIIFDGVCFWVVDFQSCWRAAAIC